MNIGLTRLFLSLCGSIVMFVVLSVVPSQVHATTRYVSAGGCGGASPCYSTIQGAVTASDNGDEIRVASGTYSSTITGGGITAVVRIDEKKITLKGGYATSNWNTSNPTANPTIIDANDNGICVYVNYNSDTGIGQIIIDGFSITDGSATEAGAGKDSGGGIYIDQTTHVRVTVQNCKIYENYAEDGSGGGIWSTRSDNLNVTDNEIYDNAGSGINLNTATGGSVSDNVVSNNHNTGG